MPRTRGKMLVVDDIITNRMILKVLFDGEYDVIEAENGVQALEMIKEHNDELEMILLDIVMPELDGFGVLERLGNSIKDRIPVIIISGENDDKSMLNAYKMGVADLIEKPFNSEIVQRRVQNVSDLYRHKREMEKELEIHKKLLDEQTKKIQKSNRFVIDVLSTTVEFRSLESGEHVRRVRLLTEALLREAKTEYPLSDEEIEIISNAAAIHDIGKIAIPDAILHKPGILTTEEFEVMKTHTIKGCEILENINSEDNMDFYNYYYEICRHHHERWDGRGYPDGLKGDEISIWAQATGLADVYDALVNERVYKRAYSHEEAMRMICDGECGEFNPVLLEAFKRLAPRLKNMEV